MEVIVAFGYSLGSIADGYPQRTGYELYVSQTPKAYSPPLLPQFLVLEGEQLRCSILSLPLCCTPVAPEYARAFAVPIKRLRLSEPDRYFRIADLDRRPSGLQDV